MELYNVDTFPYRGLIQSCGTIPKPKKARGFRYKKNIINAVCAFDIETTNYTSRQAAFMYVWQFAFTEDFVCIGRTWIEFIQFIERLESYMKQDEMLVIYVHNLSFEFQFLKGVFSFNNEDVFAIDNRKVLTARMHDKIEFRCSYILSNMSLSDFTKKMKVKHVKESGEDFDYSVERFPWTKLSEKELKYCIHDVVGLVEAVTVLMNTENDNLYTVPYTSTGYVRRDMKTAMKNIHYKYWKSLQPAHTTYRLLRQAFRGGNTHANRWYVGEQDRQSVIYSNYNVWTRDIASSYPAVMLNELFPIKEFIEFDPTMRNFEVLKNAVKNDHPKWALLVRVKFHNIELKNKAWGAPYLAKDKCIITRRKTIVAKHLKNRTKFVEKIVDDAIYDNGRILKATELETTITDIDFDIIKKEYKWSGFEIVELQAAEYGQLPECIKDVVRKYFRLKTELKGRKNQEVFYVKAKNKLNACYGLFATNPVRALIELCNIYEEGIEQLDSDGKPCKTFRKQILSKEDIESQLDDLERKPVFPYQWGVWVTALARRQLERGIDLVYKHYDPCFCYFVYCDTDSVKYVDEKGVVDWDGFNNSVREKSLANGGVAWSKDDNGNPVEEFVLGVYELDDNCPCAKEFKTMGAKRYAYTDQNDDIHITIAGVGKVKGAEELKEMGGLSAFKDGMVFYKAGGQIAKYNDVELPPIILPEGTIKLTSNVYLEDTTKHISRTDDYFSLTNISDSGRKEYVNFVYAMCKEYVNRIDY